MGVDMKIVLGYGYLIPCVEFEKILEEIKSKLLKRFRQEQKLVQTKFKTKGKRGRDTSEPEERPVVKRLKEEEEKKGEEKESKQGKLELVIPPPFYPGPKWFGLADDDNVLNDLRECWKIGCMDQDGYGNKDGDACVFIYSQHSKDSKETIMQRKVGFTPLPFLVHQIYEGADDIVGGARKYFAVATDYDGDYKEDKIGIECKTMIDHWFESGGLDDKESKGEDFEIGGADREYERGEPKEEGPCLFYQEMGQVLKMKYEKRFRKWLASAYS